MVCRTTIRLQPLTIDLQHPDRAMPGGVRSRRRSVGKAFGAIWPPGIMGTRRLAAAAGAGAAPSTTATSSLQPCRGSSLTEPCVLFSPARNTTTGELDRLRAALERRVRCALAGTLPGPSCGFVADVKEAGENKALLGRATRATTLTRSLLSAAVQMCRTFQKSSVNRVVRPCRDSMPGTLLSESRCRMSLSATRPLPKRRDVVDVDLIDLTNRKGNMGAGGDGAGHRMGCRRAMNRRKLAGRGWCEAICSDTERGEDAASPSIRKEGLSGGRKP